MRSSASAIGVGIALGVVVGLGRFAEHVEAVAEALRRCSGSARFNASSIVRPKTKLRPRIFIASRTAVRTTGSPRRPTARPSAAFQLSDRSCAPSSTLPVSSSEKVAALTKDESDRPSFSDQSGPASLSAISSSAVCASGMRSSASARHIIAMPSSTAEVVGVEEGVDARRLVRADALHQRARGRGRFAQRRRAQAAPASMRSAATCSSSGR